MTKSLFLIIFLCSHQNDVLSQVFSISQKVFMSCGILNAIDENQQQFNPAASHPKDRNGYHFNAAKLLQIPDLNFGNLSMFYSQKHTTIYHDLSGVFHAANNQFQTTHALAYAVCPGLQIGLGLQVQLNTQPKYYGNLLTVSARLGCQYQLDKRHYLSLVLNEFGRAAQQQICIEHALVINDRVSFAQGFSWNPQFKPTWYLTLTQSLTSAKVQFTCGMLPQSYAFSIAISKQKKLTWLVGQSWQRAYGLCFQIGLNLH
jgi:hypothetical protein